MIIGSSRSVKLASELPGMLLGAGLATLGAVGILGSRNLIVLVAAPIGGILLMFAARRPLLALCSMVVIEVTNVSGVLAPQGGLPIFQASMLLGILAIAFALRDPEMRDRLNAWTGICAGLLGVYLATQAVATIGSVDVAASIGGMRRFFLDCVFVMVLLILTQLTARPWTVAAAIVIPLAVLSVLTVINEVVFGGTVSFGGFSTVTAASGEMVTTLRYGGPLPDSNFWGRHLVMGLPFAAALLVRAVRSRRRPEIAIWAVGLLALIAGSYMTQSRGTFVAAGAAVAVWFIASDRSIRRRGMRYAPIVLLALAVPGVGNRLVLAFQDVMQADENANVDPSVLGRLAAQEEAWMMFRERPAFGFGPSTFSDQVINYAGRVPTAVLEPALAPHNLYAEFAATSGVNGLLGWAVAIFGFLGIAVLGIVSQPLSRDRVLAAAVCGAIVAWSAASIGLHLAYFRAFGVVLAMVAAVAPELPVPTAAIRALVRAVGVWCIAAVVGVVACWISLSAIGSSSFTAKQRMTLEPVGPRDGWFAYALDVRTRPPLLSTFAVLLADPTSDTGIIADPIRGVLTFSATADSENSARDRVQLAVGHAEAVMHSSIGYQQYSLQTVGSMDIVPVDDRSAPATLSSFAIGAIAAVIAGFVPLRVMARRRRNHPASRSVTQELAHT